MKHNGKNISRRSAHRIKKTNAKLFTVDRLLPNLTSNNLKLLTISIKTFKAADMGYLELSNALIPNMPTFFIIHYEDIDCFRRLVIATDAVNYSLLNPGDFLQDHYYKIMNSDYANKWIPSRELVKIWAEDYLDGLMI